MENHFSKFNKHIIGQDQVIKTPYHEAIRIVYADWTASGRMYGPIEKRIFEKFHPFVANTHTDTNDTGSTMTYAYHKAKKIIKEHVNATEDDVLISSNSGMTGVVNKFQRILGLKLHESFKNKVQLNPEERPLIFVTHMEHHSNQTSWLETIAEVIIVDPDNEGLVSVENFEKALKKHEHRKNKIAAITSCSNVTGIMTPYMEIAALMHRNQGLCFVDFACSAPYIKIDMHPDDLNGKYLDAIYFSTHKFLGGPGSTGILIFNKKLYSNTVPDHPGGGTVDWTNPWGEHKYVDNIEDREDGGTPAFLQTIKAAMCMKLKEEMGTEQIHQREKEIITQVWEKFEQLPNLHILAGQHKNRLAVISFYIDELQYNLGVKMLNDRFGIQTRGGCSCAGTYGHYLFNIDKNFSNDITCKINQGDLSSKVGWIRMSIHPTQSNEEIAFLLNSVIELTKKHKEWAKDYDINLIHGTIRCLDQKPAKEMVEKVDHCFNDSFA